MHEIKLKAKSHCSDKENNSNHDMERFAVTPDMPELGVVLKRTVGFNSTFQSVCSDRLLEKAGL